MKEHAAPPGGQEDDVSRLVQLVNTLADMDETLSDNEFSNSFEYQALQSRITVHLQSGHGHTLLQAVMRLKPGSEAYELMADELEVLSTITRPVGEVSGATTSSLFVIPVIVSSRGGLSDGQLEDSAPLTEFIGSLQATGVIPADNTLCVAPYLYRHSELEALTPPHAYGLSSTLLYQQGLTGAELFQRDWTRAEPASEAADVAIHEIVYIVGVCAGAVAPPLLLPWEDDPYPDLVDTDDHPLEVWNAEAEPFLSDLISSKGEILDVLLLAPALFHQGVRNAMGCYADMMVMNELNLALVKHQVEPRGAIATMNFVPVDQGPQGVRVQLWSRLDESQIGDVVRLFLRYEEPEQTMQILNHHLLVVGVAEIRLVGLNDEEDARPSGGFAYETAKGTKLH